MLIVGAVLALLPAQAAAAAVRPADTVLRGGPVLTVDEPRTARAVAVRDGRIVFVGGDAGARRYIGPRTTVVRLRGRTLMPGLQDGHAHPLSAGESAQACSLDYATLTLAETLERIQACLEDTREEEPDGWLSVENWDNQGLLPRGTVPVRQQLDQLPTERPILVRALDGHSAWVNTRALELAGIDRATADPGEGRIVRDAAGDATGVLLDAAINLVDARIPAPSQADREGFVRDALRALNAQGVTSVLDASVLPADARAYAGLARRRGLTVRTHLAMEVSPARARRIGPTLRRLERIRAASAAPNLRIGTVKMFFDGVVEAPTQTAALLEPYRVERDGRWVPGGSRGPLYFPPGIARASIRALDRAGWQVHVHAIGDRAVRTALDGFAAARRANGESDGRHTIAHLELVHPDDLRRFARLDVVASFSAQWAQRDAYTIDAVRNQLGEARWRRLYPFGTLVDLGARVAGGSDWPVDPLNPFNQLQHAVTRTAVPGVDGTYPGSLGAGERLSLDQAVHMHTLAVAHQLHQDRRTGSIAVGKDADLIVLDRDLRRAAKRSIHRTRVALTMLRGRVVYRR